MSNQLPLPSTRTTEISSGPRGRRWPLATLVLIAVVMWFTNHMQAPPPAPADPVADSEFSASRALVHVHRLARQPHPAGSPANAEARDYLIETLRSLGAEVELQQRLQTYDYTPRPGQTRFASIENIVARWPGRQSGPALLLMAHYDSVPNAPGAGDDASGVAAELETVRALTVSGLPLRNDLIVLFSDAEEIGLIGAQAFFGHHRWAEQVGLILNFDSRGSRGPVHMYETSEHNGALIDALVQVAPAPTASSLVPAIFQKMPNQSDMSIATTAGKAGMNFAFIEGYDDYHSPTDEARKLSLDSLQHLGSYALPLVRHFGEMELPIAELPSLHYFDLLGHVLFRYAPWLDWLVWVVAAALLAFSSGRALRHGAFTVPGLLRGIGSALLLIAGTALLVFLIDRMIDQTVTASAVLERQRGWFIAWALMATGVAVWLQGAVRAGLGRRSGLLCISLLVVVTLASGGGWTLLVVTVTISSLLSLLLWRPLSREAWIAGCLWLLSIFALAALLQLAGGAHVLLWPLLSVALLQAWRWRQAEDRIPQLAWLLAGLPAAVLLGATALSFDLMIGFDLPVVSIVPLLLLLLFFAPLIDSDSLRVTGFGVALLGVVCLAGLTLDPPWSAEHPQPVELFVLRDADQRRSYWASGDRQLADLHHSTLGDHPQTGTSALYQPDSPQPLWLSPLEDIAVAAPHCDLLAADDVQQKVRLRIRPDQAGDLVNIWLPPGVDLRGWQVDGQPLQLDPNDADRWRTLSGFALPAIGVELTLELAPSEPWPELLLVGVHNGLPNVLPVSSRENATLRHSRSYYAGSTVVMRRVAIDDLLSGGAS